MTDLYLKTIKKKPKLTYSPQFQMYYLDKKQDTDFDARANDDHSLYSDRAYLDS